MTILSKLKDPQTEGDWQLIRNVPDYARRLAVAKLKSLLGSLLNRPIWSEPSTDPGNVLGSERKIEWPISTQIAPIFRKALPEAYRELGWAATPPSDTLSSKEVYTILALGFKELFETQTPSDSKLSWPEGINRESWLEKVRSRLDQFGPLVELIDHWDSHLRKWAPTLLIHGSCATLDNVPGASDLDTLMVISRDTLCNPDELELFVAEFHKSQVYLFKFNPYMHHGHMVVTELELSELREANLPLCLIENGVSFGAMPELSLHTDSDLETLFTIQIFEHFFSHTIAKASDITTAFHLLWWMSSSVFVPVLFMQMKDGHSRWKPDALDAIREYLTHEEIDLIDTLTRIRLSAGSYFPPLLDSSLSLLCNASNLGRVIKLQKEATALTPEMLSSLEIDDKLVLKSNAMYQRLAGESVRLFSKRYFDDGGLKTCISALCGKVVIEPPVPIDSSSYQSTKEWVLNFASRSSEIVSVYQYGEVGCPGLSDLDFLVVMRDDAANSNPFSLCDLPSELQEVMGHDATFVSEKSLDEFLKVFPIFEATLLYGKGADKIAASFAAPELVLPLYTIALLAKYPSDLNYLSQLPEIRFKTILAFLHSFKHFLPLFQCLGMSTPPAVLEAINKDGIIRGNFADGEIPLTLELPEIMEIMLRATAAVAASLDKAWMKFAPHPPVMSSPLKLSNLGIEFCDNWTEEKFIASFSARILDSSTPLISLPASLGWFVSWLSFGSGMASSAIRKSLTQEGPRQNLVMARNSFFLQYEPFAVFRRDLNTFADMEISAGRSVPKYVSLVHFTPAETAHFGTPSTERLVEKRIGEASSVRRILLPRFDTLGDIVLLEGFLAALLQRFPDAEITMLVREGYDQLAPIFNERIVWITTNLQPYREFQTGDLPTLQSLLDQVSKVSWDMVLLTTYNRTWIDEILAAKLTDAYRAGIGMVKEPAPLIKELLVELNLETEVPLDRIVSVAEKEHETEKYQKFWTALFPEGGELPLPRMAISSNSTAEASGILNELGIADDKYFICAPAGTQNVTIKKWAAEKFAEVIAWVWGNYSFRPLLVGHQSERDEIAAVASILNGKGIPASSWLGSTGDIPALAALLQKSQLYIGNDTGTMHIATAVRIPVVGIFGGGTFPRFLPVGEHSLGIAGDLPCFGCYWECVFEDAPCMCLSSVADAIKAISSVLQSEPMTTNLMRPSCSVSSEALEYIGRALKAFTRLKNEIEICNLDRAARLKVIIDQQKTYEADRLARLEEFRDLKRRNEDLQTRSEELQRRNEECETVLVARLELITDLQKRCMDSEANEAAGLKLIQDLQLINDLAQEDRATNIELINSLEQRLQRFANPEEIIKDALAIILRKLHVYEFYVRHEPYFSKVYHLFRNFFARTKKPSPSNVVLPGEHVEALPPVIQANDIHTEEITEAIPPNSALPDETSTLTVQPESHEAPLSKLMEAINSPKVDAFIEGRSLAGGLDEEGLIHFYDLGASMRQVLCLSPSPQKIQILYMLSRAGCAVTCLAVEQEQNSLKKYGFQPFSEGLGEWLIDKGNGSLALFDGLLLDPLIDADSMHLLKGRLRPAQKIIFNGNNSLKKPVTDAGLNPNLTVSGVEIYDAPPQSWLDILHGTETVSSWPWVVSALAMPEKMPSGRPWPKISIVTVTLNQGAYLEETIRSVLMQRYPNLEYIVIDGGSTDNTASILDGYRDQLAHCVSEKDRGQSDALNKGFRLGTGEILAWLNSDDCYLPGTLWRVAMAFDAYDADMVAGGCALRHDNGTELFRTHHNALPVGQVVPLPLEKLLDLDGSWQVGDFFFQPEVFWTRSIWEKSGGHIDESLFYSMDYELWVRMAHNSARIVHLPDTFTLFRLHEKQKTNGEDMPFLPELRRVNAELKEKLKR